MSRYQSPEARAHRELARQQVKQFIEERIERASAVNEAGNVNPAGTLHGADAYAAYRSWYASKGFEPADSQPELTLTMFGRTFGLFTTKVRTARGVEYRGVALR